jgi:hypothetical protein
MKGKSLKPTDESKEQTIIKWIRQDLQREEIFVGLPFAKRFLRARKYDLAKTKKMIKDYFTFRGEMMAKMDYFRANSSKTHQTDSNYTWRNLPRATSTQPKRGTSHFYRDN